jgi:hypothetical protein
MRAGHRLSLISAFAVLSTCVYAQTLPWPPPEAPRSGSGAPPTAPAAPAAPMGMPMPGAAPMGGGFAAPQPFGAAEPPCMPEFFKLRHDVEQKAQAFKALTERKPPSRDDLCKQITLVSAAQAKWTKFAAANVASCGIPREVAQQLKVQNDRADQTKKAICAAGPAAAPSAPSLSDALGTARLPMPESTKSSGGSTLDTLSGNILQK